MTFHNPDPVDPFLADLSGRRDTQTMLNIHDVRKSFGGIEALRGCSLRVEEGTITGLIGPNGAGKTTLFNVISGIFRPDQGEIAFQGRRIDGLPPFQIARLGLLRTFQISRGLKRMTVFENMMVYPQGQIGENLSKVLFQWEEVKNQEKALRAKAIKTLEFVNLIDLKDAYAQELSGDRRSCSNWPVSSWPIQRSFFSMSRAPE